MLLDIAAKLQNDWFRKSSGVRGRAMKRASPATLFTLLGIGLLDLSAPVT
jgi:hypothetical protein